MNFFHTNFASTAFCVCVFVRASRQSTHIIIYYGYDMCVMYSSIESTHFEVEHKWPMKMKFHHFCSTFAIRDLHAVSVSLRTSA